MKKILLFAPVLLLLLLTSPAFAFVPPAGVDADSYVVFHHPDATVVVYFFKGNAYKGAYTLVNSGGSSINFAGCTLFDSGPVGEEKLLNALIVALLGIVCGGVIVFGFRA